MGTLTMTIGVSVVLAGGWIADAIGQRGRSRRPVARRHRGCDRHAHLGDALSARADGGRRVRRAAVVNFFAAFPWGAASAAAAEMAPPHLRAQGAALYFFVSSLLSGTVGPRLSRSSPITSSAATRSDTHSPRTLPSG
jgi:hypothetical protein